MDSQKEIVLEGYMLKQSSRSKKIWNQRYFVFTSDNRIVYYERKGDPKPKNSFGIGDVNVLDVSELYADKLQKEMIYCIRISWGSVEPNVDEPDEMSLSVEEKSTGAKGGLSDRTGSKNNPFRGFTENTVSSTPSRLLPKAKISRNRSDADVYKQSSNSFAIRRENSPIRNKLYKRRTSTGYGTTTGTGTSGQITPLTKRRTSTGHGDISDGAPAWPDFVSLDQHSAVDDNRQGKLSPSTSPIQRAKQQSQQNYGYETGKREEQEYLRSQYLLAKKDSKLRSKQKIVQNTQLIAAAGATLGVAFLTAGAGLVAGIVALSVGVASGGTAAVGRNYMRSQSDEGTIVIASRDYETAKLWKSCLDASLKSHEVQNSTWGQLFATDSKKARAAFLPTLDRSVNEFRQSDRDSGIGKLSLQRETRWILLEGGLTSFFCPSFHGIQIFREAKFDFIDDEMKRVNSKLSVDGKPCPPMKAQLAICTTPVDAFLCLMSLGKIQSSSTDGFTKNRTQSARNYNLYHSGDRLSFDIIESIDENTDIIHVVFRPLFLFPLWTVSRDFVLYRCWRVETDGSYIVCYESVSHSKCPPIPGLVRGEMHQVITIAPLKKQHTKHCPYKMSDECFMSATVQVDPKGWVPTSPLPCMGNESYGEAFAAEALLRLLDIRDAIDQDRFIPVSFEHQTSLQNKLQRTRKRYPSLPTEHNRNHNEVGITPSLSNDSMDDVQHEDMACYDFSYADVESIRVDEHCATGISTIPRALNRNDWAEPDSNSFLVRGLTYKTDKVKINAGPSIGRLIAVDIVKVDEPIFTGMSIHPTERIQLALKKEEALKAKGIQSDMPPFIFVVNIVLPGPPVFHGVFYYAVDDRSTIDGTNNTSYSKLNREFFFGTSDEFRDKTFKLIPQIVQGNFIVRKAVGNTPAIMGKKLRQLYVRNERYMEVILDCGSSSVATGVIRLSLGYAKALVIDMGFLLEADTDDTLPERLFGCVRLKNIDFDSKRIRHVIHPSKLS